MMDRTVNLTQGAREVISFCRLCLAVCGTRIVLDEHGRIADIRGDKANPRSNGYACFKGLQAAEIHNSPDRITRTLKRLDDGSFTPIGIEQALDEIAERIERIVKERGAHAVAGFTGTASFNHPVNQQVLREWLAALGSPSMYSTLTIDQSAKFVTRLRMGIWEGGHHVFDESDVQMMVGVNPLVSHAGLNVPGSDPVRRFRAAKARGMKLIVVDPRRSETARYADVFLQIRPGTDTLLAAGMLREILARSWHDEAFCRANVDGLDTLRQMVEPFTVDVVSQHCGVASEDLVAAAHLLTHSGRRGGVQSGTGANMGPGSNLAEHLLTCINAVCGFFRREGDLVANPGVLSGLRQRRAQVLQQPRSWETGHRSRFKDAGTLNGEMMTGVLIDEIVTPGPEQIRAVISVGANPVGAIPDTRKVIEAFRSLDLLVSIEPRMTATARLSHYIFAPRLMYEHPDIMTKIMDASLLDRPFTQYTEAVAAPPEGSELIDDWYPFWGLSKRLGLPFSLDGVHVSTDAPPSYDQLLAILARTSRVPLDEIKKHPSGAIFPLEQYVEPADPETAGKFTVMPTDVIEDMKQLSETGRHVAPRPTNEFTHQLAVRRMPHVINTFLHDLPKVRQRYTYNAAFMHPTDLAERSLQAGAMVQIISAHGAIPAIVQADETVKCGVVAMAHGWGGLTDNDHYLVEGSNTNDLIDQERDSETINIMAHMTGIPIRLLAMA